MMNGYLASVGFRASDKVAVIIPFRDRHQHLTLLLHCLSRHMQKQQIEFQIFVAEQVVFLTTLYHCVVVKFPFRDRQYLTLLLHFMVRRILTQQIE